LVEYLDVQKRFAERLKYLRTNAKLTQEQLAEKLGVSRGSISFYEKCDRVPDIVFLERVAMFFGVSEAFLLGYVDNLSPDNKEIGLRLNLTDEAIEFFEWEDDFGSILSDIITHEKFKEFYNLCKGFMNEKAWRYYANWGANGPAAYPLSVEELDQFRCFMLLQIFMEILRSVRTHHVFIENYGHFSEEELEKELKTIDERINEKIARYQALLDEVWKPVENEDLKKENSEIRRRAIEAALELMQKEAKKTGSKGGVNG